jgi:phage baseplate assembly protein W
MMGHVLTTSDDVECGHSGIVMTASSQKLRVGSKPVLVKGQNGALDFEQVVGIDNLTQSLAITLTTLLGSDLFNTQFGFDGLNALVEETNPLLMRERIRVAIIQLLRKEPRVRRIVDIKLDDGRLDAPLPGSRELDVRVVFEAQSGDQASVDLGKVVRNV